MFRSGCSGLRGFIRAEPVVVVEHRGVADGLGGTAHLNELGIIRAFVGRTNWVDLWLVLNWLCGCTSCWKLE